MTHLKRTLALTFAAGFVVAAAETRAQAPAGAATLTASAVAESLVVLKRLDSLVQASPEDAAAWHRRGMIAWSLYERDQHKPPIAGIDWTLLGQLADTSLRIAAQLDEENSEYRLLAGRFLLGSGVSFTRAGSYAFFHSALAVARKSGNPRTHAEAAVETGRLHWRRYDSYANRWMVVDSAQTCLRQVDSVANGGATIRSIDALGRNAMQGVRVVKDMIAPCLKPLNTSDSFHGEADYLLAEKYFREAFEADPGFERAYRQLSMLLAERERWAELAVAARVRLNAAPGDAWAWLTIGLSTYRRTRDVVRAETAFDTALALLPTPERARLDRLERLLTPQNATLLRGSNPAMQASLRSVYWSNADPLWSRAGNETYAEFLARVTESELRWTAEELDVRGADSDRGDIHNRYGPADLVFTVARVKISTYWTYNSGLVFKFLGQATFATTHIPPEGQQGVGEVIAGSPVRWDNVAELRLDSMPVRISRLRGTGDSVDVLVATLPPVSAIRAAAEVAGPVRTDLWLSYGGTQTVAHDSVARTAAGVQSFINRVRAGPYLYRAEASAEESRYAARATGVFTAGADSASGGFTMQGFGLSDLVIADSAPTAAASTGATGRFVDLKLTPSMGAIGSRSQFGVAWETYEPGNDNGVMRYAVTIALERSRSAAGRFAARIIGGAANAIGVDQSAERLAYRYEREIAHAPIIVEHIGLALEGMAAGTYRLVVTVADRVTGRETSRSTTLVVRDR